MISSIAKSIVDEFGSMENRLNKSVNADSGVKVVVVPEPVIGI